MRIKNKYIDQLIVRVGKACNFKCIFCNVSDNESNVRLKESARDIVRNFHYKLKYSNLEKKLILVTISGGEPSIFQKETIFALKYIKSFLEKKGVGIVFDIQTNASNIDKVFAKKLSDLGVSVALVSFHTNDKDIFNSLIGIEYDKYFQKIINGIENLNNYGISIDINIILNKLNYKNFLDNLEFLIERFQFIDTFNIGFFQPHGEADKNFDELFISYQEIYRVYNEGIKFLHDNKKRIISHYVGLPACYIDMKEYSLEVDENVNFRKNFKLTLDEKKLINNINDDNKTHTVDCVDCVYNNVCSGIWKEFVGKQSLKPIKYFKYFENKKDEKYLFLNDKNILFVNYINEFSLGKRFIFLELNNIDDEKIRKIREILEVGFYKIGLFLNNKFDISILESGITNIQINIKNISKTDIKNIYKYSLSYSPQFRVNLDIFVSEYLGLEEIIEYLNIVDYDFIRFFIIKPNTEVDLNKYINFIRENNFLKFKSRIFTIGFYDDLSYKFKKD